MPVIVVAVQLAVVLLAARAIGGVFRRFGQPAVVGEMFAGLLLGPSLLGAAAPRLSAVLFPRASLPLLGWISQAAVLIYMFEVGMDLDVAGLRPHVRVATVVSVSGILVPLVCGSVLALAIRHRYAPAGASTLAFAMFVAISLSVTAFPVLARIVADRGLTSHPIGQLALTCAAIDDVLAWGLLALAVAIARAHTPAGALVAIAAGIGFAALMLGVVRPRMSTLVPPDAGAGRVVCVAVVFGVTSAALTAALGLHAIIGSFVAGAAFSSTDYARRALHTRLDAIGAAVFVPLFFAFAGLRTDASRISTVADWMVFAAIVAVAVVAKLGACAIAARVHGLTRRDAVTIGALMNARGLMELIVLNIGYELGLLTPTLFAMFVLMAVGTTSMAGPLVATDRYCGSNASRTLPACPM